TATACQCWECGSFGFAFSSNAKPFSLKRGKGPIRKSTTQAEDDVDGGINFNRIVVEKVRAIAPGADRIEGSLLQHGRSADDAEILDGSSLGDCGLQDHGTGDARGLGDRRVNRLRLLQQHTDCDTGGNVYFLGRS